MPDINQINCVIVRLKTQDRRQLHCSRHCKPALPQEHDLHFFGAFSSAETALHLHVLVSFSMIEETNGRLIHCICIARLLRVGMHSPSKISYFWCMFLASGVTPHLSGLVARASDV